jgi:hypothetical protein
VHAEVRAHHPLGDGPAVFAVNSKHEQQELTGRPADQPSVRLAALPSVGPWA